MKIEQYKKLGKTFVIAEIGQAHDGSYGILQSMIEAIAKTGVDAVKFQIHVADAESSTLEPFRVKFSDVDRTRYDYWKRMELSIEQWQKIKDMCDKLNLEFLATPFSNEAVNILEKLKVNKYKIGSGDFSNFLMLEKISLTGKEIILSTGLGTLSDLDESINFLKKFNVNYSLLQCTTKYPTKPEEIGLNWIEKYCDRYKCPVGLSDHSGEIFPSIGAVSLGASIIEAHMTFDKDMFGPDSNASLTVDQFKEMVRGIRFIEKAKFSEDSNEVNKELNHLKDIFGRALAINKNLLKGHVITFEDLEGKKPSNAGILAKDYKKIINKKLTRDKNKWDF